MRKKTFQMLFSAAIVATTLYFFGSASATAPEGYKSTLLAMGRLGEVSVSNTFSRGLKPERNEQLWLSMQETKGALDMYVQSNVWAPGGSSGWHSHPGHSLIIVTAGTVTDYEGHDPDCRPHVYQAGTAFVDPGGDHMHILRNESAAEARTIAVQFIPAHASRRVDVADPGNCHF